MDRTDYWCPRCGRVFKGIIAYRKHVNSKKCKANMKQMEKINSKIIVDCL